MPYTDCGVRLGSVASVGEWLRLREEAPDEAAGLLLAASRGAGARRGGQTADREDAVQETVLRALVGDAAALRRADPSTPLLGWLRVCNRNVRREAARIGGRLPTEAGDETIELAEAVSSLPPPFESLAREDETRHAEEAVLALASLLPQPYGQVLCWRLIHRMRWGEVRSFLNAYRLPGSRAISGRQARKLIRTVEEMLGQHRSGADLRLLHRQKYLRSKNPWIGATLPPVSSQILVGAQCDGHQP